VRSDCGTQLEVRNPSEIQSLAFSLLSTSGFGRITKGKVLAENWYLLTVKKFHAEGSENGLLQRWFETTFAMRRSSDRFESPPQMAIEPRLYRARHD